MNPWPVYETAKRHWRITRKFLTEQELRWQHPEATDEEIIEGMIEFNLAFERSFQHEAAGDENFELPFTPTVKEMARENRRMRTELFRRLRTITRTGDDGA